MLKTIAAFASQDGGTVLIGVRDDLQIVGLPGKPTVDKQELQVVLPGLCGCLRRSGALKGPEPRSRASDRAPGGSVRRGGRGRVRAGTRRAESVRRAAGRSAPTPAGTAGGARPPHALLRPARASQRGRRHQPCRAAAHPPRAALPPLPRPRCPQAFPPLQQSYQVIVEGGVRVGRATFGP
ncbi:ATP-binding protein [Streptomyces echinatus]|uniref:ATP-binding protein n=1 Tax=Streptomyces echinatus TaxID=67293 RepID=UPI00378B68D9